VTDKQLTKYRMAIVDEGHHIVATDPVKWGTPDNLRPALNTLAKTDLVAAPLTIGSLLPQPLRRFFATFAECSTSAALALLNRVRVALYGPALVPKGLGGTNNFSEWGTPYETIREDVRMAVLMTEALDKIRFTNRPDTVIYFAEQAANVELAPL
jgi:hypothetical protein